MRVCYFGTYRENYSRNQIMIEAIRSQDVEVVLCHQKLWLGISDRVSVASRGWWKISFWIRLLRVYSALILQFIKDHKFDVLIVGYPGQIDVFLARVLSWMYGIPLVLDSFMSLYLIAWERGLVTKHPLMGKVLHVLEYIAYRLPDIIIQDTIQYRDWLKHEYRLKRKKVRLVPTGADDRVFQVINLPGTHQKSNTKVLYYGSYIPNHGIPTIMQAILALKIETQIEFVMVGDGPEKEMAVSFAKEYDLHNVSFIDWIPQSELVSLIDSADICLGAFGETPQSLMTVQNKIYECMAMARAVITGESEAVQEQFKNIENIYLVERKNSASLAGAILHLSTDSSLRNKIATCGYAIYSRQFTIQSLGKVYRNHLQLVIDASPE